MIFSKNNVLLGRGRLSGAAKSGEDILFITGGNSELTLKIMKEGSRQLGKSKIVSFGDDCIPLTHGFIERVGDNIRFVESF